MTLKVACVKAVTRGIKKILRLCGKVLPLKDVIVLENSSNFNGHAWEIYWYFKDAEWLRGWKLLWLVNENYVCIPEEVREDPRVILIIKNHDLVNFKRWRNQFRAKVLMGENDMLQPASARQVTIYLNHGFPVKSTKGSVTIKPYIQYVCCSSGKYSYIMAEQSACDVDKCLCIGSPRTDAMFRGGDELGKLGIARDKYKKILIWTPTFRRLESKYGKRYDSTSISETGLPLVIDQAEYARLDAFCSKRDMLLIAKFHPHQVLEDIKVKETEHILILTEAGIQKNHINTYALLAQTDAMIADYSSISLDYLLLDRPIAYAVEDINEYSRGFSTEDPYFFMAGEKLDGFESLLHFIGEVSEGRDKYAEERRNLRDRFWEYQDGRSTERLMDFIHGELAQRGGIKG